MMEPRNCNECPRRNSCNSAMGEGACGYNFYYYKNTGFWGHLKHFFANLFTE